MASLDPLKAARRRGSAITLAIAAVERDTGLSKDTLRVWERRYGFPQPQRDKQGERAYTLDQVERLRAIKRLLDAGHRPGRVVPLPASELQKLTESTVDQDQRAPDAVPVNADLRELVERIRSHDVVALRAELARLLLRWGLARFVIDVLSPLNTAVGDAWMRGRLEIYEEHLYTEAVQGVLRGAIAAVPPAAADSRPAVLLTTLPGEPHGLGLLMAEAMLALEGCRCIGLGVQTPLWDVVLAATACRVDVVALGFTGCMSPNQIVDGLAELRAKLPPGVQVWAGGAAPALRRRRVEGVQPLASLQDLGTELSRWRAAVD